MGKDDYGEDQMDFHHLSSIPPHTSFQGTEQQQQQIKIKIKIKCSSPIINHLILQSLFGLSLSSVIFSLPNRHDPRGGNSNSSKSKKIEERSSGRIFSLCLTSQLQA